MNNIEDNTLIITNNKNKLLKSINKLVNVKIMSTTEFINSYYFTYNEKTIYYLMNKYNIKYDIAKIFINNMYYIDTIYNNEKIDKLYEMKKELLDNKLLIINDYFKEYLNNKKIVIYGIDYIPNILKKILDNYKYEVINNTSNNYKHNIYELNTLDDEVVFVASRIVELINCGIDINKIYLANLNDEYRLIIKRIFNMFNIPVSLNDTYSIYNTHTSNIFLSLYTDNINETLSLLKDSIKPYEVDIYNKIVKICNKYVWCNNYLDVKELIINDLKNTNITLPILDNSVKEIGDYSVVNDDEYLFLLSFNQGIIPIIHKDEDYLSDKEKNILNIETSIEKNSIEKDSIIRILNNTKNIFITYKLKSLTDTFILSNINDNLEYEVITNNVVNYKYSNMYNKITLSKNMDLYNKYGVISDDLKLLYSNYKDIDYRTYNNKFKGIDTNDLYKLLDNKLLLSYSSLDNYNRCNFRYYLNNILKIQPYEETFMLFIGNLFHKVLQQAFTDNFDYDKCFDETIDKELTKKEEFFIKKLKEELRFIIDTIKEQNNYSSLDKEEYEEKVYVNLEGNINVTFMGVIDKLKYKEVDDRYIVAIIDYKTGNPNLNLNNVIYGIEMQLPIYVYLTRNKFNNVEIAGFYLQKILNNEISADGKHSYLELKKKNLLLQGYSNSNTNILSYFDSNYEDSNVVKGLKTTKTGFYSYSKVIDNDTLDRLVTITEDKIKESSNNILKGIFDINPKKIGINNLGCEFCKFKDVCFKTEKDIVNLEEYKNLEFLGDTNGMD